MANASKDLDSKVPDLIKELSGYQPNQIPANDVKDVSFVIKFLANVISQNNIPINKTVAEDFFTSVSKVLDITLKVSWDKLNDNVNNSASLLKSVETFVEAISDVGENDTFDIRAPNVNVSGTRYISGKSATEYSKVFDYSKVSIPQNVVQELLNRGDLTITSIQFSTLSELLPNYGSSNNSSSSSSFKVGSVVLSTVIRSNATVDKNIRMEMELGDNVTAKNQTSCVFWKFGVNNNRGNWSNDGCNTTKSPGNVVVCSCDHLTSFSVLISPEAPDDVILSNITYAGVSVSIGALVCALVLEAVAWRSVKMHVNSRMRHIILINICTSLLFADVWFIVAASDVSTKDNNNNTNLCQASTFLMHLGYLSVFFWMLCEGLFLFYLVVIIFSRVPMKHLRAAAFAVGYGAPAVIAVVTIAVTQPRGAYTRKGVCWLDWENSRALLSFVVPALVIVGFNTIILVVVLTKILRRRSVSAAISEGPSVRVKQLAKSIAVMMPVLGVTWGLGIFAFSKENSNNKVLHYLFAIFNSLQGLFIFLFDCLMDKEVRKAIKKILGLDLAKRKGASSQGTPVSPYKSRSTASTDPRVTGKASRSVRDRVKKTMPSLPGHSTSNYDSLIAD